MKRALLLGLMILALTCSNYAFAGHPILNGYAESTTEAKEAMQQAQKQLSYALAESTKLARLKDYCKAQTNYIKALQRLTEAMAFVATSKGNNPPEVQAKLQELEKTITITTGIDVSRKIVRAEVSRLLSKSSQRTVLYTLVTLSNEAISRLEECASEYIPLVK